MIYMITPDCFWNGDNDIMIRGNEIVPLSEEHKAVLHLLFSRNGHFVSHEELYVAIIGHLPYGDNWKRKVSNVIGRKSEHEKGIFYWVPELEGQIESSHSEGRRISIPEDMIISEQKDLELKDIRERLFTPEEPLIHTHLTERNFICIGRDKLVRVSNQKLDKDNSLFIIGGMGTGKSTLAEYIAINRSSAIVNIVLDYRRKVSVRAVICTMAYYIALHHSSYRISLYSLLMSKGRMFVSGIEPAELFSLLITNIVNSLHISAEEQLIVIDGLDTLDEWRMLCRVLSDNLLLMPSNKLIKVGA